MINEKIKAAYNEIKDELIEIRHELHKNPELSFMEFKTAELISEKLTKWGIPHEMEIAKTGICAKIITSHNKKTLLIRADMDALPQKEMTNLEYKSANEGVMHACGHDMHMTVALGAAYVLNKLKDELDSNFKIIFQPGEEDTGGALPMIEEGVLLNPEVSGCIGCHVSNEIETGKISVKEGALMASPDDFDIEIIGKGGHGAYPEKCIDPIVIASEVISQFSTLCSRFTSPKEPKVISVCKINGGSFYNVIPDKVEFGGTVRAFSESVRVMLKEKMEDILKNVTEIYGAEYKFDYRFRYPPLVNDKKMAAKLLRSAGAILGDENVISTDEISMAGEDFAYFAKEVPSVFFNLGTRNEKIGAVEPLHSSEFIIDDDAIFYGVLAISRFAADFEK